MASPLDFMMKTNSGNAGVSGASATRHHTERRGSRRCKITQLMRIRPSDPERSAFDDIRGTLSVSRSGVYFHSSETEYEIGMRLFVTMPYSKEPAAMAREYLAEVVRRDPLPNGLFGIGFKILMEIGFQGGYNFTGSPLQRK
ncbi:MAG TPA: PilZ domain-containing protein [Candidatus Saccharimonadales bacterium]|nr:PilZ domain-containing protein [Candidatus Saccharimonadales bacterium]